VYYWKERKIKNCQEQKLCENNVTNWFTSSFRYIYEITDTGDCF
jgi:hypothetical protein